MYLNGTSIGNILITAHLQDWLPPPLLTIGSKLYTQRVTLAISTEYLLASVHVLPIIINIILKVPAGHKPAVGLLVLYLFSCTSCISHFT